ncbi:hypothetical protein ACFFRR_009940 [Megaselia abdita]
MVWLPLVFLAFSGLVMVSGDAASEIAQIGTETVTALDEKKKKIEEEIKVAFKTVMGNIVTEIDKMVDVNGAPELSQKLFNQAESYISMIQNIESVLRDFEKQIYQLKMHIYKDNNEGRAKMDATVSLHPRGYFSQQLYSSPTKT